MNDGRGSFRYDRQFAALFVLALALWAGGDRVPLHGAIARFALYGGLYSGALAATVRASSTLRRRVLFLVLGTLSSAAIAAIGLWAAAVQHVLPGALGTIGTLVSCAGAGAAVYAALVRWVWRSTLPLPALMSVAVGCMLAVLLVCGLKAATWAGGAWVAIAWWFAFSMALWYHDRHPSTRQGSSRVWNP